MGFILVKCVNNKTEGRRPVECIDLGDDLRGEIQNRLVSDHSCDDRLAKELAKISAMNKGSCKYLCNARYGNTAMDADYEWWIFAPKGP